MCNVNQVREITHVKESCGKVNPESQTGQRRLIVFSSLR